MAKTAKKSVRQAGVIDTDDIPITNPNNLGAVYSNNFGVSATMTDFTFLFLEIGHVPGAGQKQELKAMVTIPLLAAPGIIKAMQQIMLQAADLAKQARVSAGGNE